MPCYHPYMRHFDAKADARNKSAGLKAAEGENIMNQVHSLEAWREIMQNPEWSYAQALEDSSWSLIPCNRCEGCAADRKREWTVRQALEAKSYPEDSLYFLTLTYSPDSIPAMVRATGELSRGLPAIWHPGQPVPAIAQTLLPEDLSRFCESLKRHLKRHPEWGVPGKKLKWYACGEYGERTARPHYHLILYGLRPQDLEPVQGRPNTRRSAYLERLWGKGQIMLMPAEPAAMAYVAGYVAKKMGKGGEYANLGLLPPFQSRTPGLSKDAYEKYKERIYRLDTERLTDIPILGGAAVQPPKYWDRLMLGENPRLLWEIQRMRKESAEDAERLRQSHNTLTLEQYLRTREESTRQKYELGADSVDAKKRLRKI